MALSDLRPYFSDEDLSEQVNHEQIQVMYGIFLDDFVHNPFVFKGKTILINPMPTRVKEYTQYNSTFFHLITREVDYYNERMYEAQRCNRIHWIKPILLAFPDSDIYYYKWKDDRGICKEHYWLHKKNFMVVLKNVSDKISIVTSFCIDASNRSYYLERYKTYITGKKNC